jgi:lipid II:glycine glycyltransferase (peptidoglycan interpeptide bridge formation enzyme)
LLRTTIQTRQLDGPYGAGVRAADGKEKVLTLLNEDLRNLQIEYARVTEAASEVEEWQKLRQNLHFHYEEQIARIQREIEMVLTPR